MIDAKSREVIHYEPFHRYPHKKRITLDPSKFKEHPEILICNDLIDCQVDICSLEVAALFTENFDYNDIRKDFLTGILESDILGKTIYSHVLYEGYVAQVSTQQMYDAVRCVFEYSISAKILLGDGHIHYHQITFHMINSNMFTQHTTSTKGRHFLSTGI